LRTLLILLTCLLVSCGSSRPATPEKASDGTRLEIEARVIRVHIEGGFFGLEDAAGNHYLPDRLPAELRHDGLPVLVKARPAPAAIGFRMWGQRIIIEEIRAK